MDITIITLIEIIKGSSSVRILGNKLDVKNDKIRIINICINDKSYTVEISSSYHPIFLRFFFFIRSFSSRILLILRFKIRRYSKLTRFWYLRFIYFR